MLAPLLPPFARSSGFTRLELVVIVAILGILGSLLIPTLAEGRERAQAATCVSNLARVGRALRLYQADHETRFPPDAVCERAPGAPGRRSDGWKSVQYALGGASPHAAFERIYPSAEARPLYPYLPPSSTFRCPRDAGQSVLPCEQTDKQRPSNFHTVGCSYHYNSGSLTTLAEGGFKLPRAGALAGQKEDWPPDPASFILLHEPPARLYGCLDSGPRWFQWHRSRSTTEFMDPQHAPRRFWSPVAFVDGHVSFHDFSAALMDDPYYPYEATSAWRWYKPASHRSARTL